MNRDQALSVIESFGNGIPPEKYIGKFTVGKESDTRQLRELLHRESPYPLLLLADSGSGKSHTLQLLREMALEEGFVVSLVTLRSALEASFHKMDLIHGAVCREIEVPGREGKGFRTLMELISEKIYEEQLRRDPASFWTQLSSHWKWDISYLLKSPCLYIAVRAWVFGGDEERNLIEDWFSYPWNHYKNRANLHRKLIEDLKAHFKDPRSKASFMSKRQNPFRYDLQQYEECWDMLLDLRTLSQAAGFKDFIMLFDGTDDVVDNLNHLKWQKSAFRNMLRFFSLDQFGGTGFFAASPEFREKCRNLLVRRGHWAEEFTGLMDLPVFYVHELNVEELKELAHRIAEAYGIAYGCEERIPEAVKGLDEVVNRNAAMPVPEKAQLTVKAVVEHLDYAFGEDE